MSTRAPRSAGEGGHCRGDRLHPRRRALRRDRRHDDGDAVYPETGGWRWRRPRPADERKARGRASSRPAAVPRSASGCTADELFADVPRGDPPRDPAHRRPETRTSRRGARRGTRDSARATSSATAAVSAPTGRSPSCARSRRPCSATSTSSASRNATMTADFTEMMQRAMGKAVDDVALRMWTPQGATVGFVKQVAPAIEDLTARRTVTTSSSASTPPAPGATTPATTTCASRCSRRGRRGDARRR